MLGTLPLIKSPCRLSVTPPRIETHGTMLGQYNQSVYGDLLGLSEEEVSRLVEQGVLY